MRTTQVQIVMASHVNGANRLFGGQLMVWVDVTAAIEARRHALSDVTLAAVDSLEFIAPVRMNDTVVLVAEVTWTGRTSLEVRVETYVEHLEGSRQLVNRAYLVFVALDQDGKPKTVEPFLPQTSLQRLEWEQAIQRRNHRLQQKKMLAEFNSKQDTTGCAAE